MVTRVNGIGTVELFVRRIRLEGNPKRLVALLSRSRYSLYVPSLSLYTRVLTVFLCTPGTGALTNFRLQSTAVRGERSRDERPRGAHEARHVRRTLKYSHARRIRQRCPALASCAICILFARSIFVFLAFSKITLLGVCHACVALTLMRQTPSPPDSTHSCCVFWGGRGSGCSYGTYSEWA